MLSNFLETPFTTIVKSVHRIIHRTKMVMFLWTTVYVHVIIHAINQLKYFSHTSSV